MQAWILAISTSIAFYPVLFYTSRALFPGLRLGPNKNWIILAICALVILITFWRSWKKLFRFDRLELLTLGVFGLTLFTRFWLVHLYPYPAWSDSLHHTLLTQLTADQGRLPTNMEPYSPTILDMYHLGLYALSGVLTQLSQAPAHTALLWTAQVFNGLVGAGVFLVLDRKVGRSGALVGAIVAGLLSFQPAWYFNWGRFTQLASQTILLPAWLVTWEALKGWREREAGRIKVSLLAALLTASVFLLHFRVAGFYLPLILITVVVELYRAFQQKSASMVMLGAATIGIIAIALTLPALVKAMTAYFEPIVRAGNNPEDPLFRQLYYSFPLQAIFDLGLHHWLAILTIFASLIGLIRKNELTLIVLAWVVLISLEGLAYLTKIRLITFTNFGAVAILLYMPAALLIGAAVESLLSWVSPVRRTGVNAVILTITLAAGILACFYRTKDIELYRQFVTPTDLNAMQWIAANTPPGAVFAINTYLWLTNAPHGTDAGYWIPYFTGRKTTTGTMLDSIRPSEYSKNLVALSQLVDQLKQGPSVIPQLCQAGVSYIYIGERGDFDGPGLNPGLLSQSPLANLVYQAGGVSIFQICGGGN